MTPTLLAVSHGTADPRGQDVVQRLVEHVRARLVGVEVRQAFVDVQQPDLGSVLESIDGPVTVVPLLLGAGFHVHVDISEAVRERMAAGGPTRTARTLGPDAALTGLMADRLTAAGLVDRDAVVLAVAGSNDVRARLGADRAASMLSARLGRRVRVGHLGGAGRSLSAVVDEARAGLPPGGRVVAVNYLLAPGHFNDRLNCGPADVVTGPLAGGVQLDERLVDLVIRRFHSASHGRLALIG
jgi:sirohydrochlorin ferrochelatase